MNRLTNRFTNRALLAFSRAAICVAVLAACVSVEAFQRGAAGRPKYDIRLEVFCEGALQPMAAQKWGAELNKRDANLQGVHIRSAAAAEELDIVNAGGNSWNVKGMLKRNDTLQMPGGQTFSTGQYRQIYPHLEETIDAMLAREEAAKVAAEFTAETGRPAPTEKLPFGLNARAYEAMFADLEKPVAFKTKGMQRGEFIRKITGEMAHTANVQDEFTRRLAEDTEDVLTEELSGLSRGTALAYALRYVGYCLVPGMASETPAAKPVYHFIPAKDSPDEIFPVGHDLQIRVTESFPVILERFNANVDGAEVNAVLNALCGRMDTVILYDYNNMARLGLSTDNVNVNMAPKKVSYNELLDTVLYQAKLQKQLRVDEAGKVFLWVTPMKKVN